MMMLQFTNARAPAANIATRSEKHGDTWVTMCDIKVRIDAPATILERLESGLQTMLFRAWRDGDDPDLVNQATPDELVMRRYPLIEYPLTFGKHWGGYELKIAHGVADEDAETVLEFEDVKVDSISVTPKDGRVVELGFRMIVNPEGVLETLLSHNRGEIDFTLTPPTVDAAQRELDVA